MHNGTPTRSNGNICAAQCTGNNENNNNNNGANNGGGSTGSISCPRPDHQACDNFLRSPMVQNSMSLVK